MPSKKIKQLEREFNREIKRLKKLVDIAIQKGVTYKTPPIPTKPEKVTKEYVSKLKQITPSDIFSGMNLEDLETKLSELKPQAEIISHRTRRFAPADVFKGRLSTGEKKYEKLSPEELSARRSEAAKKAAETRRQREANDPEYRARMQESRRRSLEKLRERERTDPEFAEKMRQARLKALEKAREAQRQKASDQSLEAKEKRKAAAQKAARTRKEREASDPEFRERMQKIRRENLEKARANRPPKKEKVKKTPEELKEIRKAAAQKAAESRRIHEASDPEFKAQMDEIRKQNLEKARQKKYLKNIDEKLADESYFTHVTDIPSRDEEVLYDKLVDMLSKEDTDVSKYLLDKLNKVIEDEGHSAVLNRIAAVSDNVKELINDVQYKPYDDVLKAAMERLLVVFYGTVLPAAVQQELNNIIDKGIKNGQIRTHKPYHRGWY